MRKFSILLVIVSIFCGISLASYADFKDIPADKNYSNAINRISQLGIMNGLDGGYFNPYGILTREQFAKIIVSLNGLDDQADLLKGSTTFSDVSPNSWSCGFINLAVDKGYLKGMLDGSFHPGEQTTFAQACTVAIRALGYTDGDFTGLWPENYIQKARTLDLDKGIGLGNNEAMPRWAVAVMIDKLLSTNIKKVNANDLPKLFSENVGLYSDNIVIATHTTSDKLSPIQVQTDKGIYYISDPNIKIEPGLKYSFIMDKNKTDNVSKVSVSNSAIFKGTVVSNTGNKVLVTNNGKQSEILLPDKTVYYYNGLKQNYDSIKDSLLLNSSIVLGYNEDKTGFEYGVIFDPIFSKTQIGKDIDYSAHHIGSIQIGQNERILKNGKQVTFNEIKERNVVNEVSDIWGDNKYINVVDKSVQGILTAVLPSKSNIKSLKVDTVSYDISKDIDLNKVSYYSGLVDINKEIIVLLDRNNQIVDIVDETSNLGIIINTSSEISTVEKTKGNRLYYIKMLTSNGVMVTYETVKDFTGFKGSIVTYKFDDTDNTKIDIMFPYRDSYGDTNLDKDNSRFGNYYVSDNIKIFNMVSNTANEDCSVDVLNWSDLRTGLVEAKKIRYIAQAGEFGDINMLVFDDVFDAKYKLAYVKDIASTRYSSTGATFNYDMMVGNTAYTYQEKTSWTETKNVEIGQVYKITISNGVLDSNADIIKIDPVETSDSIQAVDRKKIKINDKVYAFNENISFFLVKKNGTFVQIGAEDIVANKNYSKISVFLDKPIESGGKVEIISVTE